MTSAASTGRPSNEVSKWIDGLMAFLKPRLTSFTNSAGVFDITVASALQKLGLLPCHGRNIEDSSIERITSDTVELLPGNRVRFHRPGTRIDLGGIAKGFAVDRAIDVLRERDQLQGLVNAGGDLAAFGSPPETIHIRDPRFPRRLLCSVGISNTALASSGRSFNPFESSEYLGPTTFHPVTQEPATEIAGATVRAHSCVIADALTKIVMIVGEGAAALLKKYQASALLVPASGEVRVTPEWRDGIGAAA